MGNNKFNGKQQNSKKKDILNKDLGKLNLFFFLKYVIINYVIACVAELVDALDSKSSVSDNVWVRVPPQAP